LPPSRSISSDLQFRRTTSDMPHELIGCAAIVVVAMVGLRHRTRRNQRLAEMDRERDLHARLRRRAAPALARQRLTEMEHERGLRARLAQREIESRAERRRAEAQARHDGEVERFLLQQRQAFQQESRTKIEEFRQDEDVVPDFLRHFVRSGLEHRSAVDSDRFRRDLRIAEENSEAERTCPICLELFAEFGGPEQCKRRVSVCHHSWCRQCDGHGIRCCPVCRRVLQ